MSRLLIIGTVKGEDAFIVETLSGHEGLSRLFEYRLELLSEHGDYKAEDMLGTNATVGIQIEGKKPPRFLNGYITRFSVLGQVRTPVYKSSTGYRYELVISPWVWFLTRTATCAIFQQKKMLDIVKAVLERASELKSFQVKVNADTELRDYCVQYRETDFQFVSRLMEQEGLYYYFEHEDGKHTMVITDNPSAHAVVPDQPELTFSNSTLHEAVLKGWLHQSEVQSGAYAIDDFDYNKPGTTLLKVAPLERTHKNAHFEIYDYPGEYTEPASGTKYAKYRMEELYWQYEISHGRTVDRSTRTGYKFKLKDHPVGALNKDWLVIGTRLRARNNLAQSGGTFSGADYECDFSVIPAATQYRPPRTTPLPTIAGPQTAIVVGPSGEEIHTDALGRVKLQFHWDRYSEGSDKDSCWVRVSNPFAGKGWGSINIPRVGQEVIVQFLEGDPDRPIITGRVYNGENNPPYDMPSKKMITGMKTRSYPNGGNDEFNELRFDDTKGSERIYLQAQKWYDVRVKHTYKEWIGGTYNSHVCGSIFTQTGDEWHTTAKGDARLISEDGEMHLGAKSDIRIVNNAGIFLDAPEQITMKSGQIDGQSDQVSFKAKKILITGSEYIDLKVGGSFISIQPGGVYIKGAMVYVNSGGSANDAVDVPATPLPDPKKPAIAMNSAGGQKSPPPKARSKPKAYSGQASAFKVAAKGGTPFVEPCDAC
jgi:type VI secretion system secreted protein VgrG